MTPYERKFPEFIRTLREAREKGVTEVRVAHPEVLGDTYEELVESLNRISDANLALVLVPRELRAGRHPRPS